jgi:hypothetical protein
MSHCPVCCHDIESQARHEANRIVAMLERIVAATESFAKMVPSGLTHTDIAWLRLKRHSAECAECERLAVAWHRAVAEATAQLIQRLSPVVMETCAEARRLHAAYQDLVRWSERDQ